MYSGICHAASVFKQQGIKNVQVKMLVYTVKPSGEKEREVCSGRGQTGFLTGTFNFSISYKNYAGNSNK